MSNLAFEYVPNIQRETVVPMTHGDFENMTFNKACFASRDNNGYSGWTLTNGGLPQNPAVQTIINGMMGFAVTSTGYDLILQNSPLRRQRARGFTPTRCRRSATQRQPRDNASGRNMDSDGSRRMTTGPTISIKLASIPLPTTGVAAKTRCLYGASDDQRYRYG